MTQLEKVERYLRARLNEPRYRNEQVTSSRRYPFVTISRQTGAGGHSLAEALLDEFAKEPDSELFSGWQVFDKQLCEIVGRDPRFETSMKHLLEEEYRTPGREFISQLIRPTIDQDIVMTQVFRVVRTVAEMGKAIIIGRAGSEVAGDLPLGVSVRLVASDESRNSTIAQLEDVSLKSAQVIAKRKDDQRARLLRTHFRRDIDNPLNYNAVWNTDRTAVREIAAAVTAMVRLRVSESEAIEYSNQS